MRTWIATVLLVLACSSCTRNGAPAARRRANFEFDVRDMQGRPIPARITFVAVEGTNEVKLSSSDAGDRRGRQVSSGNKILSLDGSGEIDVQIGTYDIYVTRGIEWSRVLISAARIDETGYTLRAQLDHVVDTTGWISGDFHVHADPSWDSYVPQPNRVIEFGAEGIDLIVSTDHNVIADYAPSIQELAASDLIDSMIGDEVTTLREGHFGIYPLEPSKVGQHYGNAWRHQGHAGDIFPAVRRDHPGALIQVNHPRAKHWMGYFKDESFDRRSGAGLQKGFTLAFDTIEVLNGRALDTFDQVLPDWFSLLDHGHVATAMGNSDTHELHTTLGGYPRNYLRVPDDRPGKTSDGDIVAALRGHHAFFTTGPILELRTENGGIGDTVTAPDGTLTLTIGVSAAPWIAVDSATLYVNGEIVKRWPIERSELPQRFEMTYPITVTGDSYVVLRADGTERMWPIAGDAEHAVVVPLAVTNPLFVDRDGDGKYTR